MDLEWCTKGAKLGWRIWIGRLRMANLLGGKSIVDDLGWQTKQTCVAD